MRLVSLAFVVGMCVVSSQGCTAFRHTVHGTPVGAVYNVLADLQSSASWGMDTGVGIMEPTEPWPKEFVDEETGLRQGMTEAEVRRRLGDPTFQIPHLWWYSREALQQSLKRSIATRWKIIEFSRSTDAYVKKGRLRQSRGTDEEPQFILDEIVGLQLGMTKDEVSDTLKAFPVVQMQVNEWWYPKQPDVSFAEPVQGRWMRAVFDRLDSYLYRVEEVHDADLEFSDKNLGINRGMSKQDVLLLLSSPTLFNPITEDGRGYWCYSAVQLSERLNDQRTVERCIALDHSGKVEFVKTWIPGSSLAVTYLGVQRGMTRETVRSMLGQPKRTFQNAIVEDWWYPKRRGKDTWSVVRFNEFGRVFDVKPSSRYPFPPDAVGRLRHLREDDLLPPHRD